MHRCTANTDAGPNSSSHGNRYYRTFADTVALVHTTSGSNHPRTDVIAFAHADPFTNSHRHGHAKPNSHSYGHAKAHTHTNTSPNTRSYRYTYHRTLADSNAGAHSHASNRAIPGRS